MAVIGGCSKFDICDLQVATDLEIFWMNLKELKKRNYGVFLITLSRAQGMIESLKHAKTDVVNALVPGFIEIGHFLSKRAFSNKKRVS